jgi:hypothetical protein
MPRKAAPERSSRWEVIEVILWTVAMAVRENAAVNLGRTWIRGR